MNDETQPKASMRWVMLAVIALGLVAMTFNWFVMPTTFGGVAAAYSIDLPQLALLISGFVIGYGIMHIPAGFLAAKFGIRATMVTGLALEGALTSLAGIVDGYPALLITRILAGVAASIYATVCIAAVSVWFKNHEHAVALGVVSASFSTGVAVGLYAWTPVVEGLGWRGALVLAGLVTLAASLVVLLVYRIPKGIPSLLGVKLSGSAIAAILRNRILWRYGLAFFGGYGAYFAASQLIGVYAAADRGFSEGVVAIAGLLVGIAGIPGSIMAGVLADQVMSARATFLLFLAIQGLGILSLPVSGPDTLWLSAAVIGFGFNGCFAVWQTAPGNDHSVPPELIGTAVGLLLTITAVGGFVMPWVFGEIAAAAGYATAWIVIGLLTLVFGVFVLTPSRRRRGEAFPATAEQSPVTSRR
ncbi:MULTISPECIES: MFS transporter [unclassified Rhodococcus (in: high G+C Gram-positive bacteria)]|uniref:MFS transporter n=1 Tax=unclassified Rhodococcus (in: high G+C Gram-positive bacteria) TaxID=192944 RepID=UPI0015F386D6|nr:MULTISPECIES: MFS transporter [unclassified Rhodococcus (in: high G+C Gram-positive bacteria)]MCC4306307.1 MFS transporter [Rhodococcus sp. 3-2]